jgi:hypothetical protein
LYVASAPSPSRNYQIFDRAGAENLQVAFPHTGKDMRREVGSVLGVIRGHVAADEVEPPHRSRREILVEIKRPMAERQQRQQAQNC